MPFDYNDISTINTGTYEDPIYLPVGQMASQANPAVVNGNVNFPDAPVNWIALTGTGNVIPGDPVGTLLANVQQWAVAVYGSDEPGTVRHSEGYLNSDPTAGIRPGLVDMPKIVLPPWANVSNRR